MNRLSLNMKKVFVLLVTAHLFLISGCISNDAVYNGTGTGERVIYMYRTGCFGNTCPSYEIELLDNRIMYLTPRETMNLKGKHQRVLTEAEYKQLINAFIDANFFKFKDEYTSDVKDLPTTYIYFSYQGKEKKIKDYHGAPESLVELEYMMMSFLDRVGWEKVEEE